MKLGKISIYLNTSATLISELNAMEFFFGNKQLK